MKPNVRAFLSEEDSTKDGELSLADFYEDLRKAKRTRDSLKEDLSQSHSEITMISNSIKNILAKFIQIYTIELKKLFVTSFNLKIEDNLPLTTRFISTKDIFQLKYKLQIYMIIDGFLLEESFLVLVGINSSGGYFLNSYEFQKFSQSFTIRLKDLLAKLQQERLSINKRLLEIPNSLFRFTERKSLRRRILAIDGEIIKIEKMLSSISQFISAMLDNNSDFFIGNIRKVNEDTVFYNATPEYYLPNGQELDARFDPIEEEDENEED